MRTVEILGVEIDNLSQSELLEQLRAGGVVFTPNVDHIVKLQSDPLFQAAYRFADYRVCDSQLLLWASKLIGTPIKEKVSGSDLFPAFYQRYSTDEAIAIFLLGSSSGVAATAMDKINAKVGRKIVVGAHSPSFQFLDDQEETEAIIRTINDSKATVLAIGVGAPKQEKWLFQYRDRLKHIKIAMAVGATIDFEAGHTKRSPAWISELGLEWLYRLLREPKRLWKRYLLEDVVFFRLLIRRYWFERRQRKNNQHQDRLVKQGPPISTDDFLESSKDTSDKKIAQPKGTWHPNNQSNNNDKSNSFAKDRDVKEQDRRTLAKKR